MQLSPQTLQEFIRLIRQWTGLALSADKDYLIRHRLAPVVRSCGFSTYEELLLRLQAPGCSHIQDAVVEAITTKETSFFRDEWFFDALFKSVLPEIARHAGRRAVSPRIRICSAGTSTGQEAYSIAMLVREFLDAGFCDFDPSDVGIVGIDISAEAIEVAKAGLYSEIEINRGLSAARIRRHFQRQGDGWVVGEPLRKLVQFLSANLLRPLTGLGAFDLILCRNVLIYFDEATRASVSRNLHAALRDHGWLALGSAESLQGTGNPFELMKFGRAFLYRKSIASR